jgi:hypothetical protein
LIFEGLAKFDSSGLTRSREFARIERVKSTFPLLALLAIVASGFSGCTNYAMGERRPLVPWPPRDVTDTLANRRDLYSPTIANGPYTRSIEEGTWADAGVKPVGPPMNQ